MEELKKVYKIGNTIQAEELETVSKGITKKALKVIEASGNRFATNIIEGRDADTFEDLCQSVAVALIENNYTITKECYKTINHYLYNYKKSQVVLHIDAEADANELNANAYIEYITTNYTQKTSQKTSVLKYQAILNTLTDRQKEIFKIYVKIQNLHEVARILKINYQTVKTTIYRIRQKLEYIA